MRSPINSQIAKRYAQALFQPGSSADRELLAEEFKNVLSVLADPSVHETFHHPRTSKSHKSELIRLMRLSPLLESFLLLIVEKSREQFLVAIEAQFQQLVLAEQKKTIADVTSAIPL